VVSAEARCAKKGQHLLYTTHELGIFAPDGG